MDKADAQDRITQSPFHRFLDLSVEEFDDGYVEIRAPYRREFDRGDGGSLHGGVIASLLDTAATYAVISELETGVPTVNLEVDYVRPTSAVDALVRGEVDRTGGSVAFSRAELLQEYRGELTTVARGRGLFSLAHLE